MNVFTLSPKVKPGLEGCNIRCVVDLPSNNLMAFISEDQRIRIYKNDGGEIIHTFEERTGRGKIYLFSLMGDILCSMKRGGVIKTWVGSSGKVLETYKVPGFVGIWKLDDTRFAVMTDYGSMLIFEHLKGRKIKKSGKFVLRDSGNIREIRVHGSVIMSLGNNRRFETWNYLTKEKLGSLEVLKSVKIFDVSETYIAFTMQHCATLHFHLNSGKCAQLGSLQFTKNLPPGREKLGAFIRDVVFISSNRIIVTCKIGIYFVLLPSMELDACFEFGQNNDANTITILQNGSIYAVGSRGHCINFQAPETWRRHTKAFAERLYKTAPPSARKSKGFYSYADIEDGTWNMKNEDNSVQEEIQPNSVTPEPAAEGNESVNNAGSRKRTREEFEIEGNLMQVKRTEELLMKGRCEKCRKNQRWKQRHSWKRCERCKKIIRRTLQSSSKR